MKRIKLKNRLSSYVDQPKHRRLEILRIAIEFNKIMEASK